MHVFLPNGAILSEPQGGDGAKPWHVTKHQSIEGQRERETAGITQWHQCRIDASHMTSLQRFSAAFYACMRALCDSDNSYDNYDTYDNDESMIL